MIFFLSLERKRTALTLRLVRNLSVRAYARKSSFSLSHHVGVAYHTTLAEVFERRPVIVEEKG